jgi:negative elongation factor E
MSNICYSNLGTLITLSICFLFKIVLQGSSGGFDTGGEDMNPEPVEPPPAKKHKNLYDSFVTARDREERGLAAVGDLPGSIGLTSARASNPDRPRHGNTVYVSGYHITEEILTAAFAPMGKIVNISMEVEKVEYRINIW